VQHLIATYGYAAVFLLMLAESACIPIPSELIMTFGGALAAGAIPGTRLNLIAVILAGVAGNVAGSYLAWAVGRYGVLIGRVLPVVRTFISLPAGMAGMKPLRFGLYTTIGCIPWTAALGYAGYALGANWQSIANGFHGPTYIIAALVVIVLAIAIWRYARRRKAEFAAAADPQPDAVSRPPRADAPH
jgi:membrane protein DedA with SNARE-associated domain